MRAAAFVGEGRQNTDGDLVLATYMSHWNYLTILRREKPMWLAINRVNDLKQNKNNEPDNLDEFYTKYIWFQGSFFVFLVYW